MADLPFNFFQHWYPISPIEDLDPTIPTSVVLLGQRVVVWKPPTSNQYRVFLDQCPHRLAPLSEGRVDEKTGHLMCSYHGWQFDAQGVCTHIPQADDPDLVTKNREQYCVTSLPTQEANGLLWVWLASPYHPASRELWLSSRATLLNSYTIGHLAGGTTSLCGIQS